MFLQEIKKKITLKYVRISAQISSILDCYENFELSVLSKHYIERMHRIAIPIAHLDTATYFELARKGPLGVDGSKFISSARTAAIVWMKLSAVLMHTVHVQHASSDTL